MAEPLHIVKSIRGPHRAGISLVEVLIAIFLLGMFVAGSVRVLTVMRRSSDLTRMNYQAVNMAKDRLERVRAFRFNQLNLANENNVRLDHRGNVDPDGLFRRSTSVTSLETGLAQISIVVEVLNPRTRRFDGPRQTIDSMIADYEVAP